MRDPNAAPFPKGLSLTSIYSWDEFLIPYTTSIVAGATNVLFRGHKIKTSTASGTPSSTSASWRSSKGGAPPRQRATEDDLGKLTSSNLLTWIRDCACRKLPSCTSSARP